MRGAASVPAAPAARSAFQHRERLEPQATTHEVLLIFEHLGDVPIDGGRLFNEPREEALRIDDPPHRLREGLRTDRGARLLAGHDATRTMRARAEGGLAPEALDDVA